jgi:PhnB protein
VSNGRAAIDFYQKAFDAEALLRLEAPNGRLMHGALAIHGGLVVIADAMPEVGLRPPSSDGGVPMSILVECPDADAATIKAEAAGVTVLAPVQDSFSGDRHSLVSCPFGYRWILSTRTADLSLAEIRQNFDRWTAAGSPVEGL